MLLCIVLTCFECQFIFSFTKNSESENSDPKPEPNLVPAEPIWFRLQKFSSIYRNLVPGAIPSTKLMGNHVESVVYVLDIL